MKSLIWPNPPRRGVTSPQYGIHSRIATRPIGNIVRHTPALSYWSMLPHGIFSHENSAATVNLDYGDKDHGTHFAARAGAAQSYS